MYKSRYDHKDDFLRDDDIRAPLKSAAAKSAAASAAAGAAGAGRRLEPLEARARVLLDNLPKGASLAYCAEHFPHLINRVAAAWHDDMALARYLDSLLLNDRSGRAGFPFEALEELTGLREARLRQQTGKRSV